MFERFTDRARRSLVHAQNEARALGHNYIGTEHILLGLAVEGEGVAAVVLRDLGIEPELIRSEIRRRFPPGGAYLYIDDADALAALGIDIAEVKEKVEDNFGEGALELPEAPPPPFTPKGKLVLERSLDAALDLLHNYIGTEHMLLGLLAVTDGAAAEIIAMKVPLTTAAERVHEAVAGYAKDDSRPELNLDGLYQGMLDLARIALPGPPITHGRAAPDVGDPAKLRDAFVNGRALLFDLRHADELLGQFAGALRGFAAGVGGEIVLLAPGIYLVKDPTAKLTREQRRTILEGLTPAPA